MLVQAGSNQCCCPGYFPFQQTLHLISCTALTLLRSRDPCARVDLQIANNSCSCLKLVGKHLWHMLVHTHTLPTSLHRGLQHPQPPPLSLISSTFKAVERRHGCVTSASSYFCCLSWRLLLLNLLLGGAAAARGPHCSHHCRHHSPLLLLTSESSLQMKLSLSPAPAPAAIAASVGACCRSTCCWEELLRHRTHTANITAAVTPCCFRCCYDLLLLCELCCNTLLEGGEVCPDRLVLTIPATRTQCTCFGGGPEGGRGRPGCSLRTMFCAGAVCAALEKLGKQCQQLCRTHWEEENFCCHHQAQGHQRASARCTAHVSNTPITQPSRTAGAVHCMWPAGAAGPCFSAVTACLGSHAYLEMVLAMPMGCWCQEEMVGRMIVSSRHGLQAGHWG
jgi:hypothetical protein